MDGVSGKDVDDEPHQIRKTRRGTFLQAGQCMMVHSTVKPRYSAFQGTGQNYPLYRGFHYCQYSQILL